MTDEIDLEVRRLLLESGAVRFGEFTLTSGKKSDVYADVKKAWGRPDRLRAIARALARKAGDAEQLAGIELGAVPLVVATALESGLPYAVVRRAAREHGTGRRLEGEIRAGARCLLIEDVVTTGGSVAEGVRVLRDAGLRVDRVLTVVDREEGGAARLRELQVRLEALTTLRELRSAT